MTFLFTDVEGSTQLWDEYPEPMRKALAKHDSILRSVIEQHDGYVFSKAGDAFAAAFWTPSDAVKAAVETQRLFTGDAVWAEGPVLRVRIAVHTGAPEERDGDYFGPPLNRAARMVSAAHGGQILVSLAAEELLRDQLPADVTLTELGEHRLRGLSRPERVFQVTASGLPGQFPPLAAAARATGNLPIPVNRFVGQSEDLKRLVGDLTTYRLVTLTGPGGVGKSRLATEAGWALSDAVSDGVWLVELAPVADPGLVAQVVVNALRLQPQERMSVVDAIVDGLRDRRLLLVLDNCEHVLDAAAEIAERVVRQVPTVGVLATSREPLGVEGERVWPVRSLDPAGEGVELFMERAVAADADFQSPEKAAIASICAHLDGVPLAIELAAARVRSFDPTEIAARLDDRFRLLRVGPRGRVERHRTLEAAVEWSYRLLDDDSRLLFDRLSVFSSSFDLSAVVSVCGDPIFDVPELLASLVDKSLVVADHCDGATRFRLLETLRQYGGRRLAERGEVDRIGDRHLAYYVRIAEIARERFEGLANGEGAALFTIEWDNLRTAFARAMATHDTDSAEALVRSPFWYSHLYMRHELGDWAQQLAALAKLPPAFGVAGVEAWALGDLGAARRFGEAGIAAAATPNGPDTDLCWLAIFLADFWQGRTEVAQSDMRHAVHAAHLGPSTFTVAAMAACAAWAAAAADNASEALSYAARSREIARPLANAALDAWNDGIIGIAEFATGHRADGLQSLRHAQKLAEVASPYLQGVVRMSIATVATSPEAGIDPEEAYRDAITRLYAMRAWSQLWVALESLAAFWVDRGRTEPAAVLFGHLEANQHRHPRFATRRARALQAIGAHPEAPTWATRGREMTRDELVAYLLA